ncbi:HAD family hydrolase [Glaciihabitans sp. INWT7]|uniref:HAD family hydrolase n=1 Tax=Glaciihabitans sp. INWT7 TaxID=2596912 RepID=UPI0016256BF1|nr:HAD family hydrolase [Glaciihabitans sp. INWT7]QNE45900.1 HAD family hydrolase [Glaciihabitans sp. INWT7]
MTTRAVLFDVDGTLVDSNYLHVRAWSQAFAQLDLPIDSWRIHAGIGMDSALLLRTLLADREAEWGDRASELHGRFYSELSPELRPLSGARELIAEVARRGHTAVLATSAPEHELETLREALQVDDFISVMTTSEDVDVAKPAPDIVQIALDRAGVNACDAVFVGDSLWDVEASARAGVKCVALRSGGTGALELFNAGAFFVWDDPAELLAHYSETFEWREHEERARSERAAQRGQSPV